MQLLPRLTSDPRVLAREALAGDRLPYLRHVDDRTIVTRDGLLMQVVRLGGLMFETADTDELNYRKALRDAMLQAIGTSRFALYHHIVRRRVAPSVEGSFDDAFSRDLDNRWRSRLDGKALFANDLYLTIIRRPLQGRGGIADRLAKLLGSGANNGADVRLTEERRALDAAVEQLVAALGSYTPRVLSA